MDINAIVQKARISAIEKLGTDTIGSEEVKMQMGNLVIFINKTTFCFTTYHA